MNDEKWGFGTLQANIPAEIAKLTGYGNEDDLETLLMDDNEYQLAMQNGFNHITGPDEVIKLDSIKALVESLTPYNTTRDEEKKAYVDVMEVCVDGQSGVQSTMTLKELLSKLHKIVVASDSNAGIIESPSAGFDSDEIKSPTNKKSHHPVVVENAKSSSSGGKGSEDSQEDATAAGIDDFAIGTEDLDDDRRMQAKSKLALSGGDNDDKDLELESLLGGEDDGSENTTWTRRVRELQYHDLRYLRYQLCNPYEEPSVLVRRHAVLMSLNPLRAIITAERLFLIVPSGCGSLLPLLNDLLQEMWKDDVKFGVVAPFETRAYGAVLATIAALHTQEYDYINSKAEYVFSRFRKLKTLPVTLQEVIRLLKNAISSQTVKVAAYRRLLEALYVNADDLALMNLSLMSTSPELYRKPLHSDVTGAHEDITNLVESYLMDYNTLSTKLEYLRCQIQSAEDLVFFRLDNKRNELLAVDMTLSTISLTVALTNFITATQGMNMNTGIDDLSVWWFWGLTIFMVVLMVLLSFWLLTYFKLRGNNAYLSAWQ